jgi:hypothetical protein
MPPPLSTLGVFHTFATVLALYLAFDNYLEFGRINLKSRSGFVYWLLTAFGCISTVWLVARTGQFGPGHALAAIIVALLVASWILESRIAKFTALQAILLTTTVLLSLIPAVMETLTRLPLNAPLASGPEDLLVKASLAVVFVSYLAAGFWHIKRFRTRR